MTALERRTMLLAALGLPLAPRAAAAEQPEHDTPPGEANTPGHDIPPYWIGHEQVAMLLYPGFTAMDLVGPQYYLAGLMWSKVHLVAKTDSPVTSDTDITIVPTATFDTCPADLDILFTPGGASGTIDAMMDPATMAFMADRGSRARWVTSVCTGSLILGKAGLLRGYRATSHWCARSILPEFGAVPVDERVVVDRNRITGAGVTAGLDLGLRITAMLRDDEYARCMQLLSEYDPQPPFGAGSPEKAPHERELLAGMLDGFAAQALAAAKAS